MINWFSLTLVNVFCLTSFYLLTKKILTTNNDPTLYGGLMNFLAGVFGLVLIIFSGFDFRLTFQSGSILLAQGIIYAIAISFYYKGLQKVDLSKGIILGATSVIWSLVIGRLLLKETLTLKTITAALLIFTSVIIVSYNKKSLAKFTRAELFILIAAIFYTIGACIDNYMVNFSSPTSYLSLSFLMPGIVVVLVNLNKLRLTGKSMIKDAFFIKGLLMNSFILVVAYTALFYAYKMGGQISKIYPITGTQTVIIAVLSIIFLKENKNIARKILAAFLTFAGMMLIRG